MAWLWSFINYFSTERLTLYFYFYGRGLKVELQGFEAQFTFLHASLKVHHVLIIYSSNVDDIESCPQITKLWQV